MGLYSSIIQAVIDRMTYHCKPGRLLAGVKFVAEPESDIEGADDYPVVRMFVPELTEERHPTFGVDVSGSVNLLVSNRRTAGIVAHAKLLELVLDCLEIGTDGTTTLDTTFGRKLDQPPLLTVKDVFAGQNAIHGQIWLSFTVPLSVRGTRRL